MKNLTWKGKLIIGAVILAMIILIIIGIAYLPVWSTIEAFIMLVIGFFFGWMLRAKKESNPAIKDEVEN